MNDKPSFRLSRRKFVAATVGGATSVGRKDLGRLEAGALADIIIIDLSGRGTLRYGPVRDPIKSLVECGIGDDIETVIVDGRVVMENGTIPGINLTDVAAQAQEAGEQVWETLQEWDPIGRTHVEACPWCYAMDD